MDRIKQLPWGVLGILIGIAVISSGLSFLDKDNVTWGGLLQNFGTEMAGAVVTYLLISIVLGTKETKKALIAQMGSRIRDVAIPAFEELKRNNWLNDGSLRGANLAFAELEEVELDGSNLEAVNLFQANLREAGLTVSNFRGAELSLANLENAYLTIGFHYDKSHLPHLRLSPLHPALRQL